MTAARWTKEQQAAIDLDGQLLVAAGAGSGKTAVLVERLLKRILEPKTRLDIRQVLVVTFTRAAAAEMAGRVRKALEDALFKEEDGAAADWILRQLALLDQAPICNLHSFCLDLIRRYFYRLGLDPAFRVADPGEIALLRQDVLREVLEGWYERGTPQFEQMAASFIQDRSDDQFTAIILRLSDFSLTQAHPEIWLRRLAEAYHWDSPEDFLASPWGEAVRQKLKDEADACAVCLQNSLATALLPGGPSQYRDVVGEDLQAVRALIKTVEEGSWEEMEEALKGLSFPKLPAARRSDKGKDKDIDGNATAALAAEASPELREKARKLRDEAKKGIKALVSGYFIWPLGEQLRRFSGQGEIVAALAALVIEFHTAYTEEKRRRNVIDYSDMEHLALQLLENEDGLSPAALELQAQFQEVMIDEYQDTNPIQERLLQLLVRTGENPASFFMVGDIKQSIYRFRMADPTIFLEKLNTFEHYPGIEGEVPQKTGAGLALHLNRNFRSRSEIIDGVNAIFSQIMIAETGGIVYDQTAALQYGAGYPEIASGSAQAQGETALYLIDMARQQAAEGFPDQADADGGADAEAENDAKGEPDAESEQDEGSEKEAEAGLTPPEDLPGLRQEARYIAEHIRRLVGRVQVFDKTLQAYRPSNYADIVVLLRSAQNAAAVFREEFQIAGIPLYSESNRGYFEAAEVDTMLSLLNVIDNPHQDIPLAGVLRSSFGGLNGRELGTLRSLHPGAELYELLVFLVWAALEQDRRLDATLQSQIQDILLAYQPLWEELKEKAATVLNSEEGLKDKILSFWHRLQAWRTFARGSALPELIWKIYDETDYLAYTGVLPDGKQRQANLYLLYERARQFEATRSRGLFRFLRFLERFRRQGQDMGNAAVLRENKNLVRIQTIHGSKGLEYPIVFVAGLGRRFNRMELHLEKVLLHGQLGVGLPLIDPEHHVEYPSLIRQSIRQRLFQESLAEEMRILYVALTRAKERLYLYGAVKDLDRVLENWEQTAMEAENTFSGSALRRANSFLDWIVPSLFRRAAVITDARDAEVLPDIPEQQQRQTAEHVWTIRYHAPQPSEQLAQTEPSADTAPESGRERVDPDEGPKADADDWQGEIARRLNWQYPHAPEVASEAKISVSELKRRWHWMNESSEETGRMIQEKRDFQRPAFTQSNSGMTAAEQGTAIHSAMQHLPLREWQQQWPSISDDGKRQLLQGFGQKLVEQKILTAEQTSLLTFPALQWFFQSELAGRIGGASEIRRETPFTLSLPRETGTPVLLQGMIDVLLIYADGSAEIVDYKTDHFPENFAVSHIEEALAERYTMQLSLYAAAVQRLTRLPVHRATIYSFALNREMAVDILDIQTLNDSLKIKR